VIVLETVAVNSSRPRLNPHTPADAAILSRSARPTAALVTAIVTVAVLTAAGFALKSHPVDLGLAQSLNALHVHGVAALTDLAYHLFSPAPAIASTVIVTAVIWLLSRQVRVAAAFAGVVAISWVPSDLIKDVVHRTRPDVRLMPHPFSPVQPDPSFPSGHVVFVTSLVIALFLVLQRTAWAPVVVVAGTILVVLVSVSLMIDAVHYPTDVLASLAWGLGVVPAARVVWVDWLMPRIPFLKPASGATE
jgi:undecaprenyl-diphosphatase